MARFCGFIFCLTMAAARTQLSHVYNLVSDLIDYWVEPYYMLIIQAGMLRATESAGSNMIPPSSLSPIVSSRLLLPTPGLHSSTFPPLLFSLIYPPSDILIADISEMFVLNWQFFVEL